VVPTYLGQDVKEISLALPSADAGRKKDQTQTGKRAHLALAVLFCGRFVLEVRLRLIFLSLLVATGPAVIPLSSADGYPAGNWFLCKPAI
jgi:hypothetical protein